MNQSPNLSRLIAERFQQVLLALGAPSPADPQVRVAQDARFGDYQCNAALSLAKAMKLAPRALAENLVSAVDLSDIAEPLEIAGPGFINIRVRPTFLATRLAEIPAPPTADSLDRMGLPTQPAQRIVVDYSSPNIAKQMHVGHLRSTILGDVFARVLAFMGHTVIRQNHVGDWGTSIGMVILGKWHLHTRRQRGESIDVLRERLAALNQSRNAPEAQRRALLESICADWSADLQSSAGEGFADADASLDELELGYVFVQTLTSLAEPLGLTVTDASGKTWPLAAIPREVTRMMQAGGEHVEERSAWARARQISLDYCQQIYDRLGVWLTLDDVCGESFYHPHLPALLEELRRRLALDAPRTPGQPYAVLRDDAGAACIYLMNADGSPQFVGPEGDSLPMIVQKSDGAFLYASTDLAAVRHRLVILRAQRVIYVVGAPQKLHFEMLFAAARAIGWVSDQSLEHTPFGSVLGDDRRPLRTRSGENVKLRELLDEAERRAYALLAARESQPATDDLDPASTLSEADKQLIAQRVGIAAVKYADLRNDRNSNYVFDWDKMLSFQGNTAPYLLYAYARIRSIYRRGADATGLYDSASIEIREPTERALALRLARFPETLDQLAADLSPHLLCAYLYDLAADFMRFYEACPVLKADEALRCSRLRLCDLTARTLKLGLHLLGIEVLERM